MWRTRTVQATIFAALLWLGRIAFGLWWLIFPIMAALVVALICLGYASVLWWLDHHPE